MSQDTIIIVDDDDEVIDVDAELDDALAVVAAAADAPQTPELTEEEWAALESLAADIPPTWQQQQRQWIAGLSSQQILSLLQTCVEALQQRM